MKKKIAILGSTGSIGVNTLNVIDTLEDQFDIVYLSTFQNKELIIEQAKKYQPKAVVIVNDSHVEDIQNALEKENIEIKKASKEEIADEDLKQEDEIESNDNLWSSSDNDILGCPKCARKLKVPYEKRPAKARCPACETIFEARAE